MNHTLTRVRGKFVVLLALLIVFAALGASRALAESPPNPPARFVGTVLVDGVPAAGGTRIEARIGSTTCGVAAVFISGSEARYTVDSPALDPGATPNCGTEGAAVTFFVAGVQANETGTWENYQLNIVNLTVTTAVPTPGATPRATPGAPVAGTGGPAEGGVPPLFAIAAAVLGVMTAGAAGIGLARKLA